MLPADQPQPIRKDLLCSVNRWEDQNRPDVLRLASGGGGRSLRGGGRGLRVRGQEPDLVAAPRRSGVVVHGHHVAPPVDTGAGAQQLQQQTDLTDNRLLRGRPEKNPERQVRDRQERDRQVRHKWVRTDR